MKIFIGNKAKGLKRIMDLLDITDAHLKVEGRIPKLEKHPDVKGVDGDFFRDASYVKLREKQSFERLTNLLRKHGFPEPSSIIAPAGEVYRENPIIARADFVEGKLSYTIFFKV